MMIGEKEIKEIIDKSNPIERDMCEVIKAYIYENKSEDIGDYNLPTGKIIQLDLFTQIVDVQLLKNMFSFAKDYYLEKYKEC